MFRILVERPVAVLAPSDLVLTDEGTMVDFVVGAGCGLIQMIDKLVDVGPGVAAVNVDAPDGSGVHFGGFLIFGRRRVRINILWGRG